MAVQLIYRSCSIAAANGHFPRSLFKTQKFLVLGVNLRFGALCPPLVRDMDVPSVLASSQRFMAVN